MPAMIPPLIAIHLARKPLEGTVAANALKHGTGSLNIDESRLGGGSTERPQGEQDNGQSMRDGTWQGGTTGSTKGRWPVNAILQHKNGCKLVGSKKVKGTKPTPSGFDRFNAANAIQGYRPNTYQKGVPEPPLSRLDVDGTETVDAWECVEGCPVADLDEQSGDRPVSGRARQGVKHSGESIGHIYSGDWGGGGERLLPNDSGGASRYFKQIGGNKP